MNEIIEKIKALFGGNTKAMYAVAGGLVFVGCAAALMVAVGGKKDDYLKEAREEISFESQESGQSSEGNQKPYEDSIGFLRGANGGGGEEQAAPQEETPPPQEEYAAPQEENQEDQGKSIQVGELKSLSAPPVGGGQSSSKSEGQMTRKLSKLEGSGTTNIRSLSSNFKASSRMDKSLKRGAIGAGKGGGSGSLAKKGSAFGLGGADGPGSAFGKSGSGGSASIGGGSGGSGSGGLTDSKTGSSQNDGAKNQGGGGSSGDPNGGGNGFKGHPVCFVLGSGNQYPQVSIWDACVCDGDIGKISLKDGSLSKPSSNWLPTMTETWNRPSVDIKMSGIKSEGSPLTFKNESNGSSGGNTGVVLFSINGGSQNNVWSCTARDAVQEFKVSAEIEQKMFASATTQGCKEILQPICGGVPVTANDIWLPSGTCGGNVDAGGTGIFSCGCACPYTP